MWPFLGASTRCAHINQPSRCHWIFAVVLACIAQYKKLCVRFIARHPHLCSLHMIKTFKRNLSKLHLDKGTLEFIMRCLAVLLNMSDLTSATDHYKNMCVILESEHMSSSIQESLQNLHNRMWGVEDIITELQEYREEEPEPSDAKRLLNKRLDLSNPFEKRRCEASTLIKRFCWAKYESLLQSHGNWSNLRSIYGYIPVLEWSYAWGYESLW